MRWMLLLIVAAAGLNAIRPAEAPVYDTQIGKACGTDATCIHRHLNARRDSLGNHWATDPMRYIPWTPDCPGVVWVSFWPCYDTMR